MSDGIDLAILARGNVVKAISGRVLQDAFVLDVSEIVAACEAAAVPGLAALRQNVSGIRKVTGRLSSAPAITTRYYRRKKTGLVGVALVGYRSGVAPHASLVEFGTKRRSSKKGNRGAAPAQRPLTKAFTQTRSSMESKLSAELQRIMASKAESVGR